MRLTRVTIAVALCVLLSPSIFAQSECPAPGTLTFATTLAGTQFGGQGSPGGFGTGFITLNPRTNQILVRMNVGGIGANITGAGLFRGTGGGTFSNVFLPFTDANNTFENGTLTRTITVTPNVMNAILADPGAFSIGITTGEFPNGAVAGPLSPLQTLGGTLSGAALVGSTGATTGGGAFTAQLVTNLTGSGWLLNYSLSPTGIGGAISGVELRQGAPGSNGPVFATLTGNATLNNGLLTGSIPLTTDQALAVMSNPGNFFLVVNTPAFPSGAVRAQVAPVENELFIPVAGAVAGANGTRWATDLNIFNLAWGAPATVTIQFLPSNQSNGTETGALTTVNVATTTVGPRSVNQLTASIQSLFSLPAGIGALRLVSDQPIVATARVFNDQHAIGRGTYGEHISALSRCEAIARGVLIGIAGSSSGSSFVAQRTNAGFFNPNGSPVQVNLSIGNQGTTIATATMTLQPFEMVQLPVFDNGNGALFPTLRAGMTSGAITYEASAPIFAYASIVDNQTGDTGIVIAKRDITAQPIGESDIAGILVAANQGEIQINTLALSRTTTASVRSFAQKMIEDHTADLGAAQTLFASISLSAASNLTTQNLQAITQQARTILTNTPTGAEFDRAYIQNQVQMHQMMLGMLDTMLIPSARSTQLIQFLETQRTQVAAHLALAQQILQSLQ
jgi:putative membrane protein